MRRTVSRYEQFETSPETIEQELRPVVCEQRQTERIKENYKLDRGLVVNKSCALLLDGLRLQHHRLMVNPSTGTCTVG